jgi:hypothetical protein
MAENIERAWRMKSSQDVEGIEHAKTNRCGLNSILFGNWEVGLRRYGGGEAGFPENLFKNQHRLSNPPPYPNKASCDDDIYLIMITLMGSTDLLCRIFSTV